jgi:hypothetical protein
VAVALIVAVVLVSGMTVAGTRLIGFGGSEVRAGGLSIRVGADGGVDGVAVGERELPMLGKRGGFTARLAGGNPNLVENPGFEQDDDGDGTPDGWRLQSGRSRPVLDREVAHGGAASLRLTNRAVEVSGSVVSEIPVRAGRYYTVSVWMRTDAVQPTLPSMAATPPRLEATQLRADGPGKTFSAFGYTDTTGWNRFFVGFQAEPEVERVQLRAVLDDGSGTVWFDDVHLSELLGKQVEVPARTWREDGDVRQVGGIPGTNLRLAASLVPREDHVLVAGAVRGDGEDRAFQVSFTLPVDARGWRWGDDPRRERTVVAGDYVTLSGPPGQTEQYPYGGISQPQRTSQYPFGGVADDRTGLAIGVPLSVPRAFRIGYTSDGLEVTFDLGTSPDSGSDRNGATFAFVIYPSDGAWGFRSMAERYYAIFPGDFERRTDPDREGNWLFAPPLDSLPGDADEDFPLGLHTIALGKAPPQTFSTWGTKYVGWANERGLYASAYTHQWTYFQPLELLPGRRFPAFDAAMAEMQRLASAVPGDDTQARRRDEAGAGSYSGSKDVNGRPYYEHYPGFLSFYQNLDAVREDGLDWSETVVRQQIQRAIRLAREAGGRLDGIHMDSTSGARRWGAVNDYDREHWAASEMPLTFSYNSGLPAQLGILQMHPHIRRVAEFVHDRGMLLSANFNGGENRTAGWLGADLIDYFGIEQGLPDKAGGIDRVDPLAMVKRVLAYQRPVTSLDTDIADGSITLEVVEDRIRQSLFYAIYPGAWVRDENEDDQTVATWSRAEVRAVYAPYARHFRDLSAAGWEPVTHARTDDPRVWVERYGSGDEVRFTIRNETDTRREYALTIDLDALGLDRDARVTELLSGEEAAVTTFGGDDLTLRLVVEPRDTQLLLVSA